MVTLVNNLIQLGNDLIPVIESYEETYNVPNLNKKLNSYRKKLQSCIEYEPTKFAKPGEISELEKEFLYHVRFGCENGLKALEGITADGDIFDILESLRKVYFAVRFATTEFVPSHGDDFQERDEDFDFEREFFGL